MKIFPALLVCVFALAACDNYMQFPVTRSGQEDLPPNLTIVRVTPENIVDAVGAYYEQRSEYGGTPPGSPARYTYRLGAGDQLRIQVWTTPERKVSEDTPLSQPALGPVVDETGHFFYPFVGEIQASGRTVGQIRAELTEKLQDYLRDPQVEVAVEEYRAHRVTITGVVETPGLTVLTNVPLTLVDLLNAAGTNPRSDLSRVKLRRNGTEYVVNAQLFLDKGKTRQNPVLLPGDIIYVPELRDNQVFVFGEIQTTAVPLSHGEQSLTEILAKVGGINRQRANARGVFVFRRTNVTTDGFDVVFQFDLTDASTLMTMQSFPVMPLDIVFVTKDPVTRWTDTVGRVLAPATSLVMVSGIINDVADDY